MSKNYYAILEIPREASELEICEAYRKLALKWHPLKNKDNPTGALHMFHELAEAYDVLSDASRRNYYDQYGEYGLKEGVSDSQKGFIAGYRYAGNAEEIFEKFFGTDNPYFSDYIGLGIRPLDTLFGSATGGLEAPAKSPPSNVVVPVDCTLAELYNGCEKEVSYSRVVLNADRVSSSKMEFRKRIEVRRGYSSSSQIVFPGEGNESTSFPNSKDYIGDLIFQIVEVPHRDFKRNGNDLIYTAKVTLLQSLLAEPISIVRNIQTTLDGRVITVSFDQIVSPQSKKLVENEGMPILKDNEYAEDKLKFGYDRKSPEKGNLIVRFDISFPRYIPEEDKRTLRNILS